MERLSLKNRCSPVLRSKRKLRDIGLAPPRQPAGQAKPKKVTVKQVKKASNQLVNPAGGSIYSLKNNPSGGLGAKNDQIVQKKKDVSNGNNASTLIVIAVIGGLLIFA